jgi:hypothetical protein
VGRRRRAPGRHVAWPLAAAACALLAGACRDLVTDEVIDAEARLCAQLTACDIDGCGDVSTFFASGDDPSVDMFLGEFVARGCDGGCGDAPLCLDFPGICRGPGQPCTTDAACCGSTGREARCQPLPEEGSAQGARACCVGLGVACLADEDCCALDGGQPVECTHPEGAARGVLTCGGAPPCDTLGEACTTGDECCSGTCVDGACDRVRCVQTGARCEAGDTCCSASEQCVGGTCQAPPECPGDGCPCGEKDDACTPGASGTCCDALLCVPTGSGGATCASPDCLPFGADCASDDACRCGGARPGAACLEVASGGAGAQRTCQPLACEPVEGNPCGAGRSCCASAGLECSAGAGDLGTCVPACEPSSCERDPFAFGPPITPESRLDEPTPGSVCAASAACAEAVCELDPYCCCFLWDEICVAAAEALSAEVDPVCVRPG